MNDRSHQTRFLSALAMAAAVAGAAVCMPVAATAWAADGEAPVKEVPPPEPLDLLIMDDFGREPGNAVPRSDEPQPYPAGPATYQSPENAAVDSEAAERVEAYLEDLGNLQGTFLQIGPDGSVAEGLFYLQRPGRIRFEYTPPHPLLIVASDAYVTMYDRDLGTFDEYPVSATPLRLLLDDDVDFDKEVEIVSIEERPGQLRATLRDRNEESLGQITLVFEAPDLQLRQWVIEDAQGLQTTIALQNVETGIAADPELFEIKRQSTFRRGQRN